LISSELEEVRRCSNRLLVLYDGRKVGEFGAQADKDEILGAVIGVKGDRREGADVKASAEKVNAERDRWETTK
jgi:ABC-type sugar transport system ATPase subunit